MDPKREQILNEIDRATAPDVMGWREALQFLEELSADLDGRIEALREENKEE